MSLCSVISRRNNTKIGTRFSALRKLAGLSLDALSSVSGISKATLSRIENGSKTFEYSHIEILSSVFGFDNDSIHSSEFNLPSETQVKNSIKKYIKKNKLQITFADLYRNKPGAAYYVDKMVESSFLNEKRTMKEITEYCYNEFGVNLVSSHITNILKRREEKGIIEIIKGNNINGFRYRKVK